MLKGILILFSLFLTTVAFAAVQTGIQGRSRGDVIAVKTDSQVMTWCDFSKSVVKTEFNVLCVYNGNQSAVSD